MFSDPFFRTAMSSISTAEIRSALADVLNRTSYGKERLVITRRGRDIAAIVPVEDLALLEALEDRIDLEDARKALAETGRKGSIPWTELKASLGL